MRQGSSRSTTASASSRLAGGCEQPRPDARKVEEERVQQEVQVAVPCHHARQKVLQERFESGARTRSPLLASQP
jgi:hypothetical protein